LCLAYALTQSNDVVHDTYLVSQNSRSNACLALVAVCSFWSGYFKCHQATFYQCWYLDYLELYALCCPQVPSLEQALLSVRVILTLILTLPTRCVPCLLQHEKFQSAPGSRVGTPAYLAPEVILTTKGKTYDGKVAPVPSNAFKHTQSQCICT